MFPGEWSNGSTVNSTLKSLNIKLWFMIYFFRMETTAINFLVPNNTKDTGIIRLIGNHTHSRPIWEIIVHAISKIILGFASYNF